MSTREQFIEVCGGEVAAIAWEHKIHCAGAEFLPACALAKDSSEYWQFLINQVQTAQSE